jgi:hypothetical protein
MDKNHDLITQSVKKEEEEHQKEDIVIDDY